MKKNLTFLTGIVFLITILTAGACGSAPENDSQTFTDPTNPTDPAVQAVQEVPEEVDTVIIYLVKAYEENGKKHLKMSDSHNPGIIVDDDLETFVWPGTVVIWEALNDSGIKKLKKISPKDSNGNIMHRGAKGFFYTLFNGKKKHKVPDNAPRPSDKEGYLIKFKHVDKSIWEIDPYLEIPEE